MSPLFTFIVIVLAVLAVLGIVVGVANDAVNFLNSALGSKVAPRRTILWVASAGILIGTLTSSGMMEVARSGVFYPSEFTFPEVMMLFLGMMLGNVLLLDEPTNDIDVNTLRALEEGLENFAGCAVVISHDRWFLDRIATHILSFEGDSKVVFYEGSYSEYEAWKRAQGGDTTPHRVKYKKLIEN